MQLHTDLQYFLIQFKARVMHPIGRADLVVAAADKQKTARARTAGHAAD